MIPYGDAENPDSVVLITARLDRETLSSGLLSTTNFFPETSTMISLQQRASDLTDPMIAPYA